MSESKKRMGRGSRFGIFLFSTVAVLYIAWSDMTRTSPGALAAVHQREAELTGWGSCKNCHGGWFGNMTNACLSCHEDVGKQMKEGDGLHGKLAREDLAKAERCGSCHSDHHGEGFPMVNKQSFAAAGVKDRAGFAHELVGFVMDGKHLELQCAECHEYAETEILPKGERRFIGLSKACYTCHEDPHRGEMGTSCEKCHNQTSFVQREPANHARFLALTGPHAKASCRDCHAKGTTHSLEVFSAGKRPKPRTCASCHESPHGAPFIRGIAKQARVAVEKSCRVCHLEQHMKFNVPEVTVTPEQHVASGFPLDVPHHEAECSVCHASSAPNYAARYPGRKANDCISCHHDPHGGQFTDGAFAAIGCVACHDRHRFEPHAFDLAKHEKTSFPLTGAHRETTCNDCHKTPAPKQPRRFRGTEGDCHACHGDAHRGYFDGVIAQLPLDERKAAVRKNCALCHDTTSFNAASKGFDHGRWTGFPLDGAHRQMACEGCHARAEDADPTGRRFGFAAEQFRAAHGRAAACSTCHRDPHGGLFDDPKRPTVVEGKADCARCHNETSFRTIVRDFDHGLWTGFPLDGGHAKAGCSDCHVPLSVPDADGRTWGRANGRRCANCHKDPHAGQFKREGRTDCERCHRSSTRFADLVFDHDTHSRFRLDEAHRGLACDACHKPTRIRGATVVRYRPMGRKCADCHGANHEPFRRRRGRKR